MSVFEYKKKQKKLPMTTLKPLRQRVLLRLQRISYLRGLIGYSSLVRRKPKKWVFIVGCYNSGTTILDQIMSFVPGFSGLPTEGVILTDELPFPEQFGWARMWAKCIDEIEFPHTRNSSKADKIKRSWYPYYSSDAHVFLEKSISNVPRMRWLDLNFENCYFIGITRDPYAVSEGIHRKARPRSPVSEVYGDQYPIELAAKQWLVSLERMRAESNFVKNYHEITYDALIKDPEKTIRQILLFLGEPSPKMSFRDGYFQINEGIERLHNQNNLSWGRLSTDDYLAINQTLKESQKVYGYEEKNASGENW